MRILFTVFALTFVITLIAVWSFKLAVRQLIK